jgi:hypothetical protein
MTPEKMYSLDTWYDVFWQAHPRYNAKNIHWIYMSDQYVKMQSGYTSPIHLPVLKLFVLTSPSTICCIKERTINIH